MINLMIKKILFDPKFIAAGRLNISSPFLNFIFMALRLILQPDSISARGTEMLSTRSELVWQR